MKKILVGLWLALVSFSASAQDNCTVNPELCMTAPIAKSCPTGKKWTTAGSGIAHCVNVDPVCPSAEKVAYDSLGNPSCVARCTASDYWDGSVCRPCTTNSTASGSCQAGYNGTAYRSVTTNSCAGTTSYGNWDYSQCVVACTTNNWSESAACPAGYNGTMSRSNSTNSCSGTTYGGWNTSGCSVQCTTSSRTEAGTCQSDYAGTAYRTVTSNSCTGSETYGPWNYAGCTYSPAASQCYPDYKWCWYTAAQSGDPRDATYDFGEVKYLGPTCEETRYFQGQRSALEGGCPPGYNEGY